MKLIQRLTLVLVLATSAVLAAHGYLSTRRDIDLFESDMRRDVQQLGHVPVTAVSYVLKSEGEERALHLIEVEARAVDNSRLRVRWVRPGSPRGHPMHPDIEDLKELETHDELTRLSTDASGDERFYTYFAVRNETTGPPSGALEISESLGFEHSYIQTTIRNELITVAVLACTIAGLAALLGMWLVGRPVSRLVAQARRIGAGDLTARLDLERKDELGDLAQEMNHMCDQLASAQRRITAETQARIATLEQLRRADRLATVGRLAAGIAHELGTPLNVVSGRAEAIATREVAGDDAIRNATIVVEQTERMATIIRQLLDFSRPSGSEKAPCDLGALVVKTVTLLTPLAEKAKVDMTFTPPAPPVMVDIDAAQVQQALMNLVVNGTQAMPQGGTLTLGIERQRVKPPSEHGGPEADYNRLSVRDTGVGITEENLAKIFEPFFTTKGVGEGTGLGLPVSYGIIREHGGWIGVESQVGKGSTFSIYLPQGKTA
jgi:signal transduction histidine kinase